LRDEAINWMGKAFHPPGDHCPAPIPDRTVASSLFPEYRETAVISKPALVEQSTWDVLIIKPPGNCRGAYWLAGPPGSDFNDPAVVDAIIGTGIAGFGYVDIQTVEPTDPTSVSGISLVNPVVPATDVDVLTLYPTARPMCWRKAASSLTCYLNAAAVADQGTVYATQVSREYKPMECRLAAGSVYGSGSDTGYPLYRACPVNLPVAEADMMAVDPKVYMAPARAGVYLPLKPFGDMEWQYPLHPMGLPFLPRGTTDIFFPVSPASAGIASAMECTTHALGKTLDPATNQWTPVFWFGFPDRDSVGPADSSFDEWNTGVVLFRGLDAAATVTLRVVDVIQQMPASSSIYRPFVKPPPLFEPRALELYFRTAEATPNAYPANYNSWGKIWDVVKKVAREVWPVAEVVAPAVVGALTEDPEAAAETARTMKSVKGVVKQAVSAAARIKYKGGAGTAATPGRTGRK